MNAPHTTLADLNPDTFPGFRVRLGTTEPLDLDSGAKLANYQIAYQTYGTLNAARDNVILVCHALTGDQFVAETNPVTKKAGWWSALVGPDKIIDTNKWFVICSNILGGCMGSEGPSSVRSDTGEIWGMDFPVLTIHDMVRAQKQLVDHLGIDRLACVIGGSTGGMQALSWAALYPDSVKSCIALATTSRQSAQNIALNEVGRQTILADRNWQDGNYHENGAFPHTGLGLARMLAHITYLSDDAFQRKFGRAFQDKDAPTYGFVPDFAVESYLHHQADSFVQRFDPLSYLYITRAVDYFDLAKDLGDGTLTNVFSAAKNVRFLISSISSDWLYPTKDGLELVDALTNVGARASFTEIQSDKGHDAFLLDEPVLHSHLRAFIGSIHLRPSSPRSAPSRDIIERLAADHLETGGSVLDIGCGDGALLARLAAYKQIKAFGLDINPDKTAEASAKGIAVLTGNANTDLKHYPDGRFDLAILNNTLSELLSPRDVLLEMARIAKISIVSVSNFAHWKARLDLALHGRAPVTKTLPHQWYNANNLRFCTLRDFKDLADELNLRIIASVPLSETGCLLPAPLRGVPNVFAARGLFVLGRK